MGIQLLPDQLIASTGTYTEVTLATLAKNAILGSMPFGAFQKGISILIGPAVSLDLIYIQSPIRFTAGTSTYVEWTIRSVSLDIATSGYTEVTLTGLSKNAVLNSWGALYPLNQNILVDPIALGHYRPIITARLANLPFTYFVIFTAESNEVITAVTTPSFAFSATAEPNFIVITGINFIGSADPRFSIIAVVPPSFTATASPQMKAFPSNYQQQGGVVSGPLTRTIKLVNYVY